MKLESYLGCSLPNLACWTSRLLSANSVSSYWNNTSELVVALDFEICNLDLFCFLGIWNQNCRWSDHTPSQVIKGPLLVFHARLIYFEKGWDLIESGGWVTALSCMTAEPRKLFGAWFWLDGKLSLFFIFQVSQHSWSYCELEIQYSICDIVHEKWLNHWLDGIFISLNACKVSIIRFELSPFMLSRMWSLVSPWKAG